MRKFIFIFLLMGYHITQAQQSLFVTSDTMRGALYYNQIIFNASQVWTKKTFTAIGFSGGSIEVEFHKKTAKRSISFEIVGTDGKMPTVFALGEGVALEKNKRKASVEAEWFFPITEGSKYQFMVTALADSADKFTIYTAYIHLPETGSLKLLAAFKRSSDGTFLNGYNADLQLQPNQVQPWVQTDRGRWYELTTAAGFTRTATNARPQIDWSKNYDSLAQAKKDIALINESVAAKKTDTSGSKDGVYYAITKEGTGKYVKVTDTVTVHYKGSLLADGSIFDQTKDKPATFPLNRLIKGWQIAVPMCKVGGSVRVIIPSALAYTIRSRSKNIPPNSVLVFDIDVVDAK